MIINSILAIVTAVGSFLFLVPFLPNGQELLPYIIISTIGMLLTSFIFSALGMMFGSLFKNYKTGMLLGFSVLIVTYIISFSIEYAGNLNYLNFLSPVRYFNLADLAERGLSPIYIAVAATLIALLISTGIRGLGKRDLI